MAEKKFYTQWWFFVIIGLVILGIVFLLNTNSCEAKNKQITELQNINNVMNDTMIKEYQIIEKLQSDYLLLCKVSASEERLINAYIDVVRDYDPEYGYTLTKQTIRTC